MDFLQAGNDVIRTLPFVKDGESVTPDSASYRVLDADGTELVAATAITISPGSTSCKITVSAAHNTLNGVTRGMRVIELSIVADGATRVSKDRYIIESSDGLEVDNNSFVTMNEAILRALDMTATEGWDAASDRDRTAALIEAYSQVYKLQFYIGDFAAEPFSLKELTTDQYAELPVDFMSALKCAQVAQANSLLGSEWITDKRDNGLMSETIGESSNMYRPGKPLSMPVRRRAMQCLSGYLALTKRTGRG